MASSHLKNNFRYLGFSLIESLFGLILLSTLCLIVMKYQLILLNYHREIYYRQHITLTQLSLSEKIKSCMGNIGCQYAVFEETKNNDKTHHALSSELTPIDDVWMYTMCWNHTDCIHLKFHNGQ